ncbi:MAG: protein kinase, partial [Planctomycetaceae bacterium]|nr:protein kinase [Planctomycetaceae bacterium]
RADHRSDIYSLGCTLYFLLNQKPIYEGQNVLERIASHVKADIPSLREFQPDEIPEDLDRIFQEMVAKRPRDRFQSMTDLLDELEGVESELRNRAFYQSQDGHYPTISDSRFVFSVREFEGEPWLESIHFRSVSDNLAILLQVGDIIQLAHGKGIIHRDLKPEIVMLDPQGEAWVTDWGLSMSIKPSSDRSKSSMGGTPAYMAPESVNGPIDQLGIHSDVYLMGAILFEIITGKPPHQTTNAMKCLVAAGKNEIVESDQTGELMDIARKALSTQPSDRHQDIRAFQAEIQSFISRS